MDNKIKIEAKDFLEEIDYYNTNVEGQLYEELGIETLADILEFYHQRKLKLMGVASVVGQSEQLVCDKNELDCPYNFTSRCTMGRCDCKPKAN